MHQVCKHYTSLCFCTICWTEEAQCDIQEQCQNNIEQLLLKGEAHPKEEDFSEYVSTINYEPIFMDKSVEGPHQMGNIHNTSEQTDNTTSETIHSDRKKHGLKRQRQTTTTSDKNNGNSHNRKCSRTNEYIHESLLTTTEHIGHIPASNQSNKHLQQKNKTGDIQPSNNNIEHRLQNTNISRTDRNRFVSGDGSELLCADDDRSIENVIGETDFNDNTTTGLEDIAISSPDDSHSTQETPTFTFISHKEGLKPLPIPETRKGPTFASFDHGDHIHFLFTTKHTNNLSRTLTTILTFLAAGIPLVAEAHTTLQRVRYINRFISYLIRYGLSTINKYGHRLLAPLKQITDSLAKQSKQNNNTEVDGSSFEHCQMYTDHKKNLNQQGSYKELILLITLIT
jgi:hypothetical protein